MGTPSSAELAPFSVPGTSDERLGTEYPSSRANRHQLLDFGRGSTTKGAEWLWIETGGVDLSVGHAHWPYGAASPRRVSTGAVALLAVTLAACLALVLPAERRLMDAPTGLVDAVRSIAASHSGLRVFDAEHWGSWLELQVPDARYFADSLIELIPASAWRDYVAVSEAQPGWEAILDCWQVERSCYRAATSRAWLRPSAARRRGGSSTATRRAGRGQGVSPRHTSSRAVRGRSTEALTVLSDPRPRGPFHPTRSGMASSGVS